MVRPVGGGRYRLQLRGDDDDVTGPTPAVEMAVYQRYQLPGEEFMGKTCGTVCMPTVLN